MKIDAFVPVPTYKSLLKSGGVPAGTGCRMAVIPEIKALDDEKRTVDFIISNEQPDREGDVIVASGWKLDNFRRNPVVPFAHDYASLPVARAISVTINGGELRATAEFASLELSPFADRVFRYIQAGFLSAASVGFVPLEWKWAEDEVARPWGWDIASAELLEFSIVPVPMHPMALVDGRSIAPPAPTVPAAPTPIPDSRNPQKASQPQRRRIAATNNFLRVTGVIHGC